jgi:hypothetical protein
MATKVKLIADGVITPDQITLTTASTGTNTTAPATTAFVQQEISALVDSSPEALNTLNELAAALGDDENFSTTVTDSIATKLPLAGGTMTGDLNIVNTSGATLDINSNLAGVDSKILLHEGTSASPANGASIRYDGANNLFKIGVGSNVNTTRLTIARDTGNVGIGTSSPASLVAGGSSPILSIGGTDTALTTGEKAGSLSFITADTSFTPTYADGIASEIVCVSDSAVGGAYGLAFYTGTTTGSNRSERLRINSSGNVGIGVTSPNVALEVDGGTANGSIARFHNENTRYLEISAESDGTYDDAIAVFKKNSSVGQFAFRNSTTEYMRIDSSGNLLVGKTLAVGQSSAGIEVRGDGVLIATKAGIVQYLNRTGSNGVILNFAKDNTTVGSIVSRAGIVSTIILDPRSGQGAGLTGAGAGGDTLRHITPTNESGVEVNGKVSLGNSINGFKDLYLSGNINGISAAKSASGNRWGILPEVESNGVMEIGRYLDFHATDGDTSDYTARLDANGSQLVSTAAMYLQGGLYLGGSGSANHLDDYEEGTWTPILSFGGGTTGIGYGQQSGTYTKIGNIVCANFTIVLNSKGTSSGAAVVSALPYAVGFANHAFFIYSDRVTTTGGVVTGYIGSGTSIALYNQVSGSNSQLTNTAFVLNSYITGVLTYRVA